MGHPGSVHSRRFIILLRSLACVWVVSPTFGQAVRLDLGIPAETPACICLHLPTYLRRAGAAVAGLSRQSTILPKKGRVFAQKGDKAQLPTIPLFPGGSLRFLNTLAELATRPRAARGEVVLYPNSISQDHSFINGAFHGKKVMNEF